MEKRTVLAFVLIFIIYWFSSQYLWRPQQVEPAQQTEQQTLAQQAVSQETDERPITQGFPTSESFIFSSNENIGEESIAINNEIILENEKIKVSFTNQGALINQITLKDFFLSDKVTQIDLIPEEQAILQVSFDGLFIDLNRTIFNYDLDNQTLLFEINNEESNTYFRKIFTLSEGYMLDFRMEGDYFPLFESYSISVNSGINITEDHRASVRDIGNSFKFVGQVDRETKNVTQARLSSRGEQRFIGMVNWAAVRSKYFTMSLIPETRIVTQSVRAQRISETLGFDLFIRYNNQISSFTDHYSLYFGPVDYDLLSTFGNGMENIAELGARWLRPLATIFMFYLSFLHRYITNYGLVIIVFALTLKILLTPLTNKALSSTKKMQKLQPMLREIQAKYKNDIQKQQEELRNLYKEHNVSPLGGCFPLLLQMPIFFALYPLLRYSIDFRQAHFFGWLTDLSEPDPFWILPITMGIFMFVQQKMTQSKQDMTNMDEKQAAMVQSQKMMMYIMPPFLVFIFSSLPAGLVLYWTVFNVFSIIQQYFLNKKEN
ncbi:MAG: membrane protein insertase YidC [Candidatus Cloacimonetes bacterium]|nr:membrane protein insertase YidC [Candidatus Cloacimonadota bacterium]